MEQIGELASEGHVVSDHSNASFRNTFSNARFCWWVNHKQTHKQEIEGGYLWSPKKKKNGARNQYYDNMRLACPGDIVLSYANACISYIGYVADYATVCSKPQEFGSAGDAWDDDGWLLPVVWHPLTKPVFPKDFFSELADLLPKKYSPLVAATGHGSQSAYLAQIDLSVAKFISQQANFTPLLTASNSADFPSRRDALLDEVEAHQEAALDEDTTLSASEKQQVISARKGQGQFRLNVFKVESGCRLTGVTRSEFLIASHIKPWRCCATTNERLDGHNGLLLTPTADRLFDRGFISFSDDGDILKSAQLSPSEILHLGFADGFTKNVGSFTVQQKLYLAYHRENLFLK